MTLVYLILFSGLSLSLISAYYSIIGLMAIFSAAPISIMVMGGGLEAAKLVVTVWLKAYWNRASRFMKTYLTFAVIMLMVITSIGCFGFLSKAHLDQAVPAGDISAQVSIYDEKIKTQRDNIESARAALRQMDAAVDQQMARSTDEQGAQRAANLRRQQTAERGRLNQDISRAQAEIVKLQEQRAPIAAQARKVEAEVGPIKYIAALIYGDNPDQNLLEKAVRWVIIILVVVFDPLAIFMLLAATESYKWERRRRTDPSQEDDNKSDPEPAPALVSAMQSWQKRINQWRNRNANVSTDATTTENMDGHRGGHDNNEQPMAMAVVPEIPKEQWGGADLSQLINKETTKTILPNEPVYVNMPDIIPDPRIGEEIAQPVDPDALEKEAKRRWKLENPDDTIHRHEALLEAGKIGKLPWQEQLEAQADNDTENYTNVDFGIKFPENPQKGDAFIRVDYLPTKLYKWNGTKWIEIDKNTTDTFAYNDSYIDHLIAKIGSGEYDPELLNDNEREQIQQRLRNDNNLNG